jgi:RNA methyltransferase, TrmH family
VYDPRVTSPRAISSRQHPFVQRCRALADRREQRAVLLDGEHLVAEALRAGVAFEGVLTDGRPHAIIREIDARGIVRYEGQASVLAAASPVRTSSGVVAIATWTTCRIETALAFAPALVVGMVGVQDPGNVGGVIRSAHALGATGVLALDGTADPASWKALRGAMGSTFHVPVATGTIDEAITAAQAAGVTIAATVARDGVPIDAAGLAPPLLVLVGNEGRGLDPGIVSRARCRVALPMRAGVDSLNVSVSAALVLWEAGRLRRSSSIGAAAVASRTLRRT